MATLGLNNDSISVSLESDHIVVKRHDMEWGVETLPVKAIVLV